MSVFSQGQLDGAGKVRIPYAFIIGSGSVSMDDIEQAALDPDGAVTVDVGGGPGGFMQAEQAGPRAGADAMAVTDAPAYGDPTVANDIAQVDAPQQSAAPPAPAAPQQPAAPAQRSGPSYMARGGTRFNKDYRYTNEDFYGPRGPDIFTTDAVGGSMYIPRAGELPTGIFASYFQENQRQRAEVNGAISKFMEASQVKPTADPYQPAFNKLVTDWQNNYVAGIAEQYGGNSQLAWAEVAKGGTAANKGYLDGMRAMDALGQFVKFQWADAASYIEEVMKGNLNVSPEQKQRAYDVYYGMNSLKGDMTGGDFVKLSQETEALKRDMNELKWFNERVLPMAPEAYRKVSQEPVVEMKGGKRILRRRTKEEVDAALHDLLAKEGAATIGADEAELKKKLQSWLPRVKSETEDIKFVPTEDGGSKSGDGGAPAGPRVESTVVRTQNRDGSMSESVVITPWEETGDKPHKVPKVSLNTAKSGSVDIYSPGLTWDDKGLFYIEGINLGVDDIKKIREAMPVVKMEGSSTTSKDDDHTMIVDFITTRNLGKKEKYAAANNSDALSVLFDSRDPYEVVAKQLQQRGQQDVTVDLVRKNWNKKEFRNDVLDALK